MVSKEEKKRRKELVRTLEAEERAKAEAQLPMSRKELKGLFDWVDEHLAERDCDRTLRYTREFINAKGISKDKIIEWLAQYGGYCDCEVIANVAGRWQRDDGSIEYIGF